MNIEQALSITGFMEQSELAYIATCASRSQCIVEVGTYQGRSARAWADNTTGVLFCVDTWRDGGEAEWDRNLADCPNVCKIKMDSRRAAVFFGKAGIRPDAVFVDADHDYGNVRADILAWRPLLREGGLLLGHDYQPAYPGVIQAVDELIPRFGMIGSIWTTDPTKKRIIPIDFPQNDSWLDGPLPVSPTVPSGWTGLEKIMPALLDQFNVKRGSALEFGCEYTYSTNVLAQLFDSVTGVDWFKGDEHSNWREDYSAIAHSNVAHRNNVTLVQSSYQDWIASAPTDAHYNLCHVDLVHTYEATYDACRWAADHCDIVIAHDTQYIWKEPKEAMLRVAEETGRDFYNYERCNGLGILA